MDINILKEHLPNLEHNLLVEISKTSEIVTIPKGTVILKKGDYVKVLPITISGYIKVLHQQEIKDLLLYYIQQGESCIMSFSAGIENKKSKVIAIAGEDTKIIVLSIDNIRKWIKEYPSINLLFYKFFNKRYEELINTINDVVFLKLDERVYDYLKQKTEVTQLKKLNLKHREIAEDLGSSREVITRILKKLELENKIEIIEGKISII